MDLDGGAVLVVSGQPFGHGLGGGVCQFQIQRHQHLHPGVVIADDGHEHGRVSQTADLLHLGQVFVGEAQTIALGCVQLAVGGAVSALVIGNHLFAAAGVAGNARAAERVIRRGKAQLHEWTGDADEAAGVAAGDGHTAGVFDLFFLALQLRETVIPRGVGAESRGGIQNLHVRAEQGHDLFGSRIGQAEESEVGGVDDLCPLVHVLAALGGDAQQLNVGPLGQTVGDAQAGGAGRAVDENLHAHAFFASHAPSWALASSI